jgi:hypothetical protein
MKLHRINQLKESMRTKTNKTKLAAMLLMALALSFPVYAQVTIGSGLEPQKGALLDVKSKDAAAPGGETTDTNGGGILMPRVELVNINSLEPFIAAGDQDAATKANHKGLVVYNLTDTGGFAAGLYSWDGSQWVTFAGAGGTAYTGTAPVTVTGNAIGLTAGTANGQVLKWNGSQWLAGTDANENTTYTGSTSITLSGTEIRRAALTGDVTSTANSNATTIANDAVTSAKIADLTIVNADIANATVTQAKLRGSGTVGQVLTTTTANAAPTWVATDAIVGNEVTNATANRGLVRSGSGTAAAPYTLGIVAGTAVGQVLTWNGTNWVASAPVASAPTLDGGAFNMKLNEIVTLVTDAGSKSWTFSGTVLWMHSDEDDSPPINFCSLGSNSRSWARVQHGSGETGSGTSEAANYALICRSTTCTARINNTSLIRYWYAGLR